MEVNDIETMANTWIDIKSSNSTAESELDWELPYENPDKCLDVILKILGQIDPNPKNKLFSALAVGPLEDLLHENGNKVIDRIDEVARKNPNFKKLLNGVWYSEVDESIQERLSQYMTERW